MADADNKCAQCDKTKSDSGNNLKCCAKCKTTKYCSRECQKAHWKKHKKDCALYAVNRAAYNTASRMYLGASNPPRRPPLKGLTVAIDHPFCQLDEGTWLHDNPEQDVYKLLIDVYRLRMEDNYNLEGDADDDGIYGGAPDGLQGFRRFLRLAERRRGLLPPWWSQEKAAECEALGMGDGWSSLARVLQKSDVMEHYGNPSMPMQMRLLGEQVYGRGPGGQSGAMILKAQRQAEIGGLRTETLDVSHFTSGAF